MKTITLIGAVFLMFWLMIVVISEPHRIIVQEDEFGVRMVYVPSGWFQMGIDLEQAAEDCLNRIQLDPDARASNCNGALFGYQSPAHEVQVGGFWLDETEFTYGQYRQCIDAWACSNELLIWGKQNGIADGDMYPLTSVTVNDAKEFCEWRGGRLPTEAEWEYAARGLHGNIYPWGNSFNGAYSNLCDVNCPANSSNKTEVWDDNYTFSACVGSFEQDRSWVGAYDMFGNVSEWVDTEFAPYPNAGVSKDEYMFLSAPTIRGGGYESPFWFTTTTLRLPAQVDNYSSIALGFRCVHDVDTEMPAP